MSSILIVAAALSGLATIASDWRGVRRPLFYFAKPLTTTLVLLLAGVSLVDMPAYRLWVLGALGFCLLGDVALMFTSSRAFFIGLAGFLIAHLLFIGAFLIGLPLAPLFLPATMLAAGALFLLLELAYTVWLLPRMGRLRPLVLIYIGALTAMVLAALMRAALSESTAAWWVCAGALLFAVSDAVLAYRKFVAQPWWGQPLTLLTYFTAIGLIAWAH